jgi:hypothetical protein
MLKSYRIKQRDVGALLGRTQSAGVAWCKRVSMMENVSPRSYCLIVMIHNKLKMDRLKALNIPDGEMRQIKADLYDDINEAFERLVKSRM